jgi:hypothetical protein
MWKLVCGSAIGTSHRRTGQVCQDFCAVRIVETSSGPVLIAACADGAGSAEMAELGAKLAVETLIASAEDSLLKEGLDTTAVDQSILRAWNMAAHLRIEREAEDRGVTVRQLACTLLVPNQA